MANVLYVDDEEAIAGAVRKWLTRKGHVVYTARDIESARTILSEHHVDGLFIDLWLGTDSGVVLHEWLRENAPPLAHRTVFVTGDSTSSEQLARVVREEGVQVVAKPFDLKDLERIVATWH